MAERLGSPSSEERVRQWEIDRETEARPLPGADVSNYNGDATLRQMDLLAAERSDIARAAHELGMTSTEWTDLRHKLGRSPSRSDVQG